MKAQGELLKKLRHEEKQRKKDQKARTLKDFYQNLPAEEPVLTEPTLASAVSKAPSNQCQKAARGTENLIPDGEQFIPREPLYGREVTITVPQHAEGEEGEARCFPGPDPVRLHRCSGVRRGLMEMPHKVCREHFNAV